ncbi:protein regulator of cytokinesis 1-like isoform X2 [Babylonia areolata]|uniref:protein regulator of cytokinesis 1-like isoform X2 n=1 Tax=Babylonia areolata TaxID=304850 RepID=UPI003FD1F912
MSSTSRKQVKEKVIRKLDTALDTLNRLWEEIGIDEGQMGKRAGTVAIHLCNLVDEMVSEEQQMYDQMAHNIQRYLTDLSTLCLEMGLPVVQVTENLSMVQREKELRMKLDNMKREKQERMGRLRQLLKEDEALCQTLCSTPHYLPSHSVPTREQLHQLEAHVKDLKAEKEKRQKEFLSTKKKVQALCSEMDHEPETSLERDLICENDDAVQLTKEHMTSFENILQDLERKNKELQQEAEDLWTRIHGLWDRIELPEEERAEFTSGHKGHGRGVMTGLRAEVDRCEQLKHSNLRLFVEGTRREIAEWWDHCYYSQTQRDAFEPYQEELYTEELLQLHEQELKRLQDHYQSHKTVLDLVAKRDKLWGEMVEFEKKASDPKRFFNDRGGKFLKEEKARKKLWKELPKLEEDVKEEIERWEKESGCQFLVKGLPYQQYVDHQWTCLRDQKEQEKEERHKNRAKQMEEEMTYGSKATPNTPGKRRVGDTPSRTPLKARRVLGENSISVHIKVQYTQVEENSTPRTLSTIRKAIQSRQPPSAKSSNNKVMNNIRRRSVRQARKRLRESMQKANGGKVKGATSAAKPDLYSQTTVSRSDTSTGSGSLAATGSYHEFAKGLNQTARPNCRSSVVPASRATPSPHRPR